MAAFMDKVTKMISGLASHGHCKENALFFGMLEVGVHPDTICIVVLFACNHAGLVDEGIQVFNSIESITSLGASTVAWWTFSVGHGLFTMLMNSLAPFLLNQTGDSWGPAECMQDQ